MHLASLLTFATAYFVAMVMPGPGVTAVIARVLARGTSGAAAFIAGSVVGNFVWFAIAATAASTGRRMSTKRQRSGSSAGAPSWPRSRDRRGIKRISLDAISRPTDCSLAHTDVV